jgi:hypothetical protein
LPALEDFDKLLLAELLGDAADFGHEGTPVGGGEGAGDFGGAEGLIWAALFDEAEDAFSDGVIGNHGGLLGAFEFELVVGSAIPIGALHATDGAVVGGVNEPGFGIEDAVADMNAEDFADDEAVFADLEDADVFAFEADGGLGDTGRFDECRGKSGKFGDAGFVLAGREGAGAEVHGFCERLVDEVDDKLLGEADVAGGIFGDAGRAIAGADAEDRRAITEEIEEAEGGGIDPAMLVHGGGEGDGARGNETGEDAIGVLPVRACEIQFHGEGCY